MTRTPLSIAQAREMYSAFRYRRDRFNEESEETSFLVVLLDYGDRLTAVSCVAGEWTGVKGDLTPTGGIPKCPNGHVLMESGERFTLGLVPEVLPWTP